MKRGKPLRPDPEKIREFQQRGRATAAATAREKAIGSPGPKPCKRCGETFTPRRSPLGWTVYCSHVCSGKAHQKRRTVACSTCGTEFETGGRLGDRKTCSPKCERAAKSRTKKGARNPNYKGDDAALKRWAAAKRDACERCGARDRLQQHHVVYEQHIRRAGGDPWDPRDSMTLCVSCHTSHHKALRLTLPLALVPDAAIAFAGDLMGPAAYDYLRRRYGGEDPRVDALLNLPPMQVAAPGGSGTNDEED